MMIRENKSFEIERNDELRMFYSHLKLKSELRMFYKTETKNNV